MSTSLQPLPKQMEVPLRLADGNGSKPGDIKCYIIDGIAGNISEKSHKIFCKIWIAILIILTASVIVSWVTKFCPSSGDTMGTDIDNIIPELLTEDYEGEDSESIFEREQYNVLLIVTDDAG